MIKFKVSFIMDERFESSAVFMAVPLGESMDFFEIKQSIRAASENGETTDEELVRWSTVTSSSSPHLIQSPSRVRKQRSILQHHRQVLWYFGALATTVLVGWLATFLQNSATTIPFTSSRLWHRSKTTLAVSAVPLQKRVELTRFIAEQRVEIPASIAQEVSQDRSSFNDATTTTTTTSRLVEPTSQRQRCSVTIYNNINNDNALTFLTEETWDDFLWNHEHVFVQFFLWHDGNDQNDHKEKCHNDDDFPLPTWKDFADQLQREWQQRQLNQQQQQQQQQQPYDQNNSNVVAIAAVDCSANLAFCREMGATDYPTYRWYQQGQSALRDDYHHDESSPNTAVQGFLKFAHLQLGWSSSSFDTENHRNSGAVTSE